MELKVVSYERTMVFEVSVAEEDRCGQRWVCCGPLKLVPYLVEVLALMDDSFCLSFSLQKPFLSLQDDRGCTRVLILSS